MAESTNPERKRSRSPGYPSFSLPEAIRKAELLYEHDKRNSVPLGVAAEHWGYSPTSSAVLLSAATLKKFGLLEEVDGGAARLVKLTDLALHIVLGTEGSPEHDQAIQTAALNPPIHAELWEKYGAELPSDSNLKRILILERGFNDGAAHDLIREYKETISFAGVKEESKIPIAQSNFLTEMASRMQPTPAQSQPIPAPIVAEKASNLRQYRFPLMDSPDAELHLPTPLSEDNYELLKEQVNAFLTMTRRALIAQRSKQQDVGAGEAE